MTTESTVRTLTSASTPATSALPGHRPFVASAVAHRVTVREVLLALHPERLAGIIAALMWQRAHGKHHATCGTQVRTIVVFPGSAGYCPTDRQMLAAEELTHHAVPAR